MKNKSFFEFFFDIRTKNEIYFTFGSKLTPFYNTQNRFLQWGVDCYVGWGFERGRG